MGDNVCAFGESPALSLFIFYYMLILQPVSLELLFQKGRKKHSYSDSAPPS